MEKTWTKTLNDWLKAQGKNARVNLAYKTGLSYDLVGDLIRGDKSPNEAQKRALAKVLKIRLRDFDS